MLSISGTLLGEIFENLAVHPKLNDHERAAAKAMAAKPGIDDPQNLCGYGSDHVTFRYGDVVFRVWPYTTGATMNVGVDLVSRPSKAVSA
jgi:hypothetical protein